MIKHLGQTSLPPNVLWQTQAQETDVTFARPVFFIEALDFFGAAFTFLFAAAFLRAGIH